MTRTDALAVPAAYREGQRFRQIWLWRLLPAVALLNRRFTIQISLKAMHNQKMISSNTKHYKLRNFFQN